MTPPGEPGKRLVVFTGMNGCSAHQNDSKPSSSAFWAMKATSTLYAGSGTDTPTFRTPMTDPSLPFRRRAVYHWAPRRRRHAMRFGVFDHIEPVPGQRLDQIYH